MVFSFFNYNCSVCEGIGGILCGDFAAAQNLIILTRDLTMSYNTVTKG